MHFRHVLLFFFRKRKRKPQTCQTFTVTMLYKNPSANDGSRSFVLVISRMVLGFGGSTKLMTSERKHCSGQTHVTRHTRLQKDCLFIIQAFTTIRISWDMKEVLILFLFFGNIKAFVFRHAHVRQHKFDHPSKVIKAWTGSVATPTILI